MKREDVSYETFLLFYDMFHMKHISEVLWRFHMNFSSRLHACFIGALSINLMIVSYETSEVILS